MPQMSPTTFLIGQEEASSLPLSESGEIAPVIYQYGRLTPLGASQEVPFTETAGSARGQERPDLPTRVSLRPPLRVTTKRKSSTLQTRQLWEGTITEVRRDGFVAILSDRTDPNNPDERVAFDYAQIPKEDHPLVRPGSTFYWIIGSERTFGGQVKNVSIVQFRRLPAWTRSALARATERAQRLRQAFRAGK